MRTAGTASAHSAQQGPLLFVFTGLWYTQTANHDSDTFLYALTFRLCVFIPESERKWRGIMMDLAPAPLMTEVRFRKGGRRGEGGKGSTAAI